MDQDVAFARDIRPLFSDRDVRSMSRFFDLSSYDDVRANAERIHHQMSGIGVPFDRRERARGVFDRADAQVRAHGGVDLPLLFERPRDLERLCATLAHASSGSSAMTRFSVSG